MTITLDLPPEFEAPLRQGLRHDVLTQTESDLLLRINAPVAPEARLLRDVLLAQQVQRELTAEEQGELRGLIDAVEIANASRWQSIADLARWRGMSLPEITAELEIPFSSCRSKP